MMEYSINCTIQREFRLLAFTVLPERRLGLFAGILLMYLVTVLGNVVITGLICLTPQLHTPMYYFLCNLSIQDIIYVSSILPKFLAILITGDTGILFPGCIAQMFFFTFCVGTEFFLLTSMAYDRYVAICIPLHYTTIMNKHLCVTLYSLCWVVGFFNSLTHALLVPTLSFCKSRYIRHFYCDLKTMIALSSSDITDIEVLLLVECVFLGLTPFVLIITSYIFIIITIIKIRSSVGRVKAFSSCSSHLTVVLLFYVTSLSYYLIPASRRTQEYDKYLSLLYTALVPMLNPFVYSLRNNQVLQSMNNMVKRVLKL